MAVCASSTPLVCVSELAHNIHGEAFEVPASATAWRVRRLKAKGAPEVVYGRDGLPLTLPIEAELDDLRTEVDAVPGRYRVDAIDARNRPIDGATGYVVVHPPSTISRVTASSATESALIEAMRANTELARAVIDRFPTMMDSAATLLRAADGAGLPTRTPIANDDYDDDQDDRADGVDIQGIVAQLVPLVLATLQGRKKQLPKPASELTAAPAASVRNMNTSTNTPAPPPATMNAHSFAHIAAIQAALSPDEAALAREVAQDLAPADLQTWFAELSALSVPQAVARVRAMLQPQQPQPSEAA